METRNKIVIENYNPAWAVVFEELKTIYAKALAALVIDIQHVGSTSVPNLAAKPVLDIDIIIENESVLVAVIERLDGLGYNYLGNRGIKGREAFQRRNNQCPENGTDREWMAHHLYVCPMGSMGLKNHLQLRDYLRQNPEKAREYGDLKRALAEKHPYDIDKYVEEKTPFIVGVLKELGMDMEVLDDITTQNKAE